jgi:hypothetical protein
MLEDIEKYMRDFVGFRVENILYLYIYLNQGSLGSVRRTLVDIGKDMVMKNMKKDIKGVKNISVLKLMKFHILK